MSENLCTFGQVTENNYNQFFNPNICHVCKSHNKGKLITCDRCLMISYCCSLHKEMHFESHQLICITITKVTSEDEKWNTKRFDSLEEWIESQKEFRRIIQMDIARHLQLYEIEMFMCAKSCLICHRQINLKTCELCYSVNYCDDDTLEFRAQHSSNCYDLMLLLNLNIETLKDDVHNLYLENYEFPDRLYFHDMTTFVDRYIDAKRLRSGKALTRSNASWKMEHYVYSDYVSGSLTLYEALTQPLSALVKEHQFIVHIIGGSIVDVNSLPAWEFLLHMFPSIRKLYVVMIRPAVEFLSCEYGNLCATCISRHQKLYVQNVSESYRDYIKQMPFMRPSVIIRFQAVVNVDTTWLKFLLNTNCPLLLTSDSRHKADTVYRTMNTEGTGRLHYRGNKFRSFRPYRDYETGGVCYRNAYIITYYS